MKWLLILLLCLPVLLTAGALALNRVPLLDPPGPLLRLKVYLGQNEAATRPDHDFPELRTPRLAAGPAVVKACLVTRMRQLGWQEIEASEDGRVISAVVVTPLLGFKDDVRVQLEPDEGGTLIHARARSRVGKADFGANQRHLRTLLDACRVDEMSRGGVTPSRV